MVQEAKKPTNELLADEDNCGDKMVQEKEVKKKLNNMLEKAMEKSTMDGEIPELNDETKENSEIKIILHCPRKGNRDDKNPPRGNKLKS
jgi:hypothetical protein